ncbi:MAG: magnesium transporter [Candidatus Riflebacteria bacterium]|nr:magnesium transporter [Candidatus Riflebacteria bacterium]
MPFSSDKKHFLADIIDSSVVNASGEIVGKIFDLNLLLGDKYPRFSGIIISSNDGKTKFAAKLSDFSAFRIGKFVLTTPTSSLAQFEDVPQQVLAKSIWDKQIVDISDARVLRVNDLHLAEVKDELRLIGVDIGLKGLIRRMGWENWLCPFLKKLRLPVESEIIAWDLVESLPTRFSQLKLTVASQKIHELHPADIADILEDLSLHEGLNLIRTLDNETAAETLAEVESETQIQIIENMPSEKASDILEEMEPDEAADILQDIDETKAAEILWHMDKEEAGEVRELLKHEENTAGGLMSTGFATIYEEFTVNEAFSHLRLVALDLEIIYYIYVLDHSDKLIGVISIRDLLVGKPNTPVTEIMNHKIISVTADAPEEEVASLISKYNLLALPVLDEKECIMGVVTVDDVMELLMDNMPKVWKRRALSS